MMDKNYDVLMQDIYLLQRENQELVRELSHKQSGDNREIQRLEEEIELLREKNQYLKEEHQVRERMLQDAEKSMKHERAEFQRTLKKANKGKSKMRRKIETCDGLEKEKKKNIEIERKNNKLENENQKLANENQKLKTQNQFLESKNHNLRIRVDSIQTDVTKMKQTVKMYESSLTLRQRLLIQKKKNKH